MTHTPVTPWHCFFESVFLFDYSVYNAKEKTTMLLTCEMNCSFRVVMWLWNPVESLSSIYWLPNEEGILQAEHDQLIHSVFSLLSEGIDLLVILQLMIHSLDWLVELYEWFPHKMPENDQFPVGLRSFSWFAHECEYHRIDVIS